MSVEVVDPVYKAAHYILDKDVFLNILTHKIPDYINQDTQADHTKECIKLAALGAQIAAVVMLTHPEELISPELEFLDNLLDIVDAMPDDMDMNEAIGEALFQTGVEDIDAIMDEAEQEKEEMEQISADMRGESLKGEDMQDNAKVGPHVQALLDEENQGDHNHGDGDHNHSDGGHSDHNSNHGGGWSR